MSWFKRGVDSLLKSTQDAPPTLLGLHEVKEASATLFGLHESLDEKGYLRVRDCGDQLSMQSFLRRLMGNMQHEVEIPKLAELCCEEKKDFSEVLAVMGQDAGLSLGFSQATNSLPDLRNDSYALPAGPCEETVTLPLPRLPRMPFQPTSGSVCGGFRLLWLAEPVPSVLWLGGRPCAPLRGSCFIAPCGDCGLVDVVAVFNEHQAHLPSAFSYWDPGVLRSVSLSFGAVGSEVQVVTSDLGGEICQISLGGRRCQLLGRPSGTAACFLVPEDLDGAVDLHVAATNGNDFTKEAAFTVTEPIVFGHVGCSIELSEGGSKVRRLGGVTGGVCLTSRPLRVRYVDGKAEWKFWLQMNEVKKGGIRAPAVGFAVLSTLDLTAGGQTRPKEASDLCRAWLVGYDRGGALFCSPKGIQKLPAGSWRPAVDLEAGALLEVIWRENQLILRQDNKERARCFVSSEEGPGQEELYAVVDLQGQVMCASLVEAERV